MPSDPRFDQRIVRAVHGVEAAADDPAFEAGLSEYLRNQYSRDGLVDLYASFAAGDGRLDVLMRRAIWRAVARRVGANLRIDGSVGFKHLETFEIGRDVFIGAQSYVQGRYDGTCIIGDHVWIGPQSYFDARCLVLEEYVGWGPGAKVLGSTHTGLPTDVPIVQTDLEIKPVRVEAWADVGTGAVLLPGVTVGRGSIIGAGAVVNRDVAPFSVVAGVPARFVRWRPGHEGGETHDSDHETSRR
jgi:acetyltransferase-like isoleucine patch superfamily enzyme